MRISSKASAASYSHRHAKSSLQEPKCSPHAANQPRPNAGLLAASSDSKIGLDKGTSRHMLRFERPWELTKEPLYRAAWAHRRRLLNGCS